MVESVRALNGASYPSHLASQLTEKFLQEQASGKVALNQDPLLRFPATISDIDQVKQRNKKALGSEAESAKGNGMDLTGD